MTDPDLLIADYEKKVAEAAQRAERIRDGLTEVRATERSADGRVAVTVDVSGNLLDLRLADEHQELANEIMRTLRRAQSRIADQVQDSLSDVAGPDTLAELTRQYRDAYPASTEEPVERKRRTTLRLGAQAEPEETSARPSRPPRPPEDDGDFGDRNLLR
jgi:hypothetical protein